MAKAWCYSEVCLLRLSEAFERKLKSLFNFAENAALPHGSGTDRVLTDKDFILIDAGGTFRGYVADVTRVSACKNRAFCPTFAPFHAFLRKQDIRLERHSPQSRSDATLA